MSKKQPFKKALAERNCVICGSKLLRRYKRRKTCSHECSKKLQLQLQKEYSRTEKRKQYAKQYRKTDKYRQYFKQYNARKTRALRTLAEIKAVCDRPVPTLNDRADKVDDVLEILKVLMKALAEIKAKIPPL